MSLAVAALDGDALRQLQHVPDLLDPGAGADDHLFALDLALVGDHGGHRALVVLLEAGDLCAGQDAHALVLGFLRQAIDGFRVVGVAALLLMQDRGDALGLPVVEDGAHVLQAVGLALDEDRLVADLLLLRVDAGDVLVHHLRTDLHVADGVVAEGLRVALPHRYAVRHQAAHRRLEVIVAHDAAGDARGAGGDAGFVDHQHVLAAALAGLAQVLGQMPGRTEAMNAGADDQVFDMGGEGHFRETSSNLRYRWPRIG